MVLQAFLDFSAGWLRAVFATSGDLCIRYWGWFFQRVADVAQLVEHHLAKVRVAGSSPVIRSVFGGIEPRFGSPQKLAV